MSQCSQVKTSHAFQGCAKIVLWLHTARTENPDTPQRHPNASIFHEYHSDTPRQPPDIPQTPPGPLQGAWDANRWQQTTTDTNTQPQTPQDTDECWLSMSGGVCWHLLSSLAISYSLEMCGGVWGMSGGCLGVSEWYSWKSEALECVCGVSGFSVLAVWSHNTILAQPWKARPVSLDYTETSKYQNVYIYLSLTKMLGFAVSLFFSACQDDITNYSCKWSPCSTAP